MTQAAQACFSRPLDWQRTGRAEFPFAADVDGRRWEIRLNDFPAEPMYTLLIDAREVADFDEWPGVWRR